MGLDLSGTDTIIATAFEAIGGGVSPDELVLGMLKERLQEDDCRGGFILDGFPRNLSQAEALDALLKELQQPVEKAIQIDVDAEAIVTRLAQRAEQEGRSDDTEETVRNRLRVYQAQTAPVSGYYQGQGKLLRIAGDAPIDTVAERITACLDG